MHIGKSYKLSELLYWTRRNIFLLVILGIIPTALYQLFDFTWLAIPFTIIALLGTATAFIITFRNQETYNRTWEARQIWGATISASRSWVMMCRDYIDKMDRSKDLINRHCAWLTVLRYQLRAPRYWENINEHYAKEYKRNYSIPEMETPLEEELKKYISQAELDSILSANNMATQLLSLQSHALKELRNDHFLDEFRFLDMHSALRDFSDHQGKSERIKNFPYPRQYATINNLFVKLFCILLPFSLLEEFDRLNSHSTGILHGQMVWLVVPFSVLISWVFTSLEQVGQSTENPFEGGANDVPISQMSRSVEIDIRQMLGETDLPSPFPIVNNIIL
ncbi:MAG TPA: bestrophin family ion channel [Chitinophagaceae bacterium]|nr:bestrophin family ion channel [Chitinophagaceae bacterium]